MVDYRVNLDIFAGPLDLLLYLVRKDEVDIYDIPIAKITDQYVQYVEMLKQLDIDVAGDFLVMAATLMEIKSALLLPKAHPEDADDSDSQDPRAELVRQLLEYKKFKDAANLLNAVADQQSERHPRPDSILNQLEPEREPDLDLEQVTVWDLLDAFDAICKATGQLANLQNIKDDTPIDLYQIELLQRLQTNGDTTFKRLFDGVVHRMVMVGRFLALLELIRAKLVWVEQDEKNRELFLRALTDEPAEAAVNRAIMAAAEEFVEKDQAELDDISAPQDTETPQADPEAAPPIPITELPAKTNNNRRASTLEHLSSHEQPGHGE